MLTVLPFHNIQTFVRSPPSTDSDWPHRQKGLCWKFCISKHISPVKRSWSIFIFFPLQSYTQSFLCWAINKLHSPNYAMLSQVPYLYSACQYRHNSALSLIYGTGHSQIDLYARNVNGQGCLMEMLISFYKCFKWSRHSWQNGAGLFPFSLLLPLLFFFSCAIMHIISQFVSKTETFSSDRVGTREFD